MKNKFFAAATAGLLSLTTNTALGLSIFDSNLPSPTIHKVSSHSCPAATVPSNSGTTPKTDCMVQCYGVAKTHLNDCAAKNNSHGCAGSAKTDCDPNEWIALKASQCVTTACTTTVDGTKVTTKGSYDSCIKTDQES
jgi:uncharacterized membrane protein